MKRKEVILKLEEIYQGKPWHGQSTRSLLEGIPEAHFLTPVGIGNKSIAHLLEHLLAWRQFAIEKLKNNEGFDIPLHTAADWPTPSPVGNPKEFYLNKMDQSQRELVALLEAKDDEWLHEKTPNKSYNNSFLIQGIAAHDLYHSGQVGIFNAWLKAQK